MVAVALAQKPLKLDLGCGKNKKEGFLGVDFRQYDSVDLIHDLRTKWPWDSDSVDEIHCSHFVEHLTQIERIHFFNEVYRVLKKDAKATIVTPHYSSERAYGDPDHKWPPVVGFFYWYLDKGWRESNAPHDDVRWNKETIAFDCDFHFVCVPTFGYPWTVRSQETQVFATTHYREVCLDMICTLTKR